jgi:hypothetical protein
VLRKKKIELLSKIANYFIGQNELEKCLQFFAQVKVSLTEYQLRVAIDNHVEKVLNKYMEQGLYDEAFKAINFHRDQGVREKAKETVKTKKTYAILAFHINQKSVHANLDIILAEIGYCPTDDKLSVIESISNYYIQQHEYDNGIHFVNLLQQLYVDNKLGGINYTILVDGLIVMVVNECLKQKLYDQALKAAESHYSSGAKEYHIKRINEEKANAAAVPLNA